VRERDTKGDEGRVAGGRVAGEPKGRFSAGK
jgi:hypothetical protein